MFDDANTVIRTVSEMLVTHRGDAARLAEMRAAKTHRADAAKWQLVADTIRMLSEDGLGIHFPPAPAYETIGR